jgi:hypothetical protein
VSRPKVFAEDIAKQRSLEQRYRQTRKLEAGSFKKRGSRKVKLAIS